MASLVEKKTGLELETQKECSWKVLTRNEQPIVPPTQVQDTVSLIQTHMRLAVVGDQTGKTFIEQHEDIGESKYIIHLLRAGQLKQHPDRNDDDNDADGEALGRPCCCRPIASNDSPCGCSSRAPACMQPFFASLPNPPGEASSTGERRGED